jgi:hypothetical protein
MKATPPGDDGTHKACLIPRAAGSDPNIRRLALPKTVVAKRAVLIVGIARFLFGQMQDNLAFMRAIAVFKQIQPLPSAQRQTTVRNGY